MIQRLALLPLSAFVAVPLCAQGLAPASLGQLPSAPSVAVAPVTGTPDTFNASALVANLDAGDLVAGWTWWRLGGVTYTETNVGFLWTPQDGASVFEIPPSVYFDDNWHLAAQVADDRTVVGSNIFTTTLQTFPFRWTPDAGFERLEVPAGPGWQGFATTIADDGTIIAGAVYDGLGGEQRAALWVDGGLAVLGPAGESSVGRDLSADGSVLVGERGPSPASIQATRWVGGVERGLGAVRGASSSSAAFCSDDGQVAVGRATVGGVEVLVRWNAAGTATAWAPPAGLSLERLNAIDPRGDFAVGALTDGVPFAEDWTPFLWSATDGFRLLEELGAPGDYELAQARDVSDDGRRVVGQLQARVVFNGQPPTLAFLWTRERGMVPLDDAVLAAGGQPQGFYDALAISGDGRRILATGVERPSINDTYSSVLELGPELLVK